MDIRQYVLASEPTSPPSIEGTSFSLSIRWVAPILITLFIVALVLPCVSAFIVVSSDGAPSADGESPDSLHQSTATSLDDERMRVLGNLAPEFKYTELMRRIEDQSDQYLPWQSSLYECVFCLDLMESDDMVRRLPCGHIFHSVCIAAWYLRQHQQCPICMVRVLCSNAEGAASDRVLEA